jgi:hypothetical protein
MAVALQYKHIHSIHYSQVIPVGGNSWPLGVAAEQLFS